MTKEQRSLLAYAREARRKGSSYLEPAWSLLHEHNGLLCSFHCNGHESWNDACVEIAESLAMEGTEVSP